MIPKNYSKISAALCISGHLSYDSVPVNMLKSFLRIEYSIPVNIEMTILKIKSMLDPEIFLFKQNVVKMWESLQLLHIDLFDFKIQSNLND